MRISDNCFAGFSLSSVKALTQLERNQLSLAIEAFKEGKQQIDTVSDASWELIRGKIQSAQPKAPSHLVVRIWKWFLNSIGYRIPSASLFASISSIQTQPSQGPVFSDKDVNAALEIIYSFQESIGPLKNEEKDFLKALLNRNHSLTVTICQSTELVDWFNYMDDPIVQIVQGLIRGFRCLLTPITPVNGLYAGSILDGLNPSEKIEVVVNLDPERIELESLGKIEVYQFPIVDADPKQMGMGANETERVFKQAVFQVIASLEEKRSVLVHCMEGKNRTGMVIATVLAYLSKQDVEAAFQTFMALRGRELGASPTPIYWSFARNTLDTMNNIDSALQKLSSFVQTLPPGSPLDKREIQKRLDQNPDLLNAILFPHSDQNFHDAYVKLIENPAT